MISEVPVNLKHFNDGVLGKQIQLLNRIIDLMRLSKDVDDENFRKLCINRIHDLAIQLEH